MRCEGKEKNIFVRRTDGSVVSLEDSLEDVPEEWERRNMARETIMKETEKDRYSCSE